MIENKVAIATGASRGIGNAIASRLSGEGIFGLPLGTLNWQAFHRISTRSGKTAIPGSTSRRTFLRRKVATGSSVPHWKNSGASTCWRTTPASRRKCA